MMEAHWRSAVHPDRIEGIGAFNEAATRLPGLRLLNFAPHDPRTDEEPAMA